MAACVALLLGIGLAACSRGPELVRKPAVAPPAVLITDVAVLDVESGAVLPDRHVLLVGDRITAIADSEPAAPSGAQRISGRGATLVPGLVDMHGHLNGSSAPSWKPQMPDADRNMRAYLYCGVTTVLDPADTAGDAFPRREAVAKGELLGPHIFASGPMVTSPGGHPVAVMEHLAPWWIRWYLIPRFSRQVGTPEEARAAVEEIASHRPDVIKLSVDRIPAQAPRIRREVLAAAVDEARKRGVRAVAHVGSTEDALDAADAGVAAWMHGVYKERIADDQIARFASYGIPMVATMAVFESYALLGQGPRPPTQLERETVEADILAAFDAVPADNDTVVFFREYLESLRGQRQAWRDNVRRLHAAGVTILAGSDTQLGMFPGSGLHRELRLLNEAGLTPAQAIRAATLDPARFLAHGAEPDFGLVAEGRRADLLLVEGDPSRDLDALSKLRAVIRDGVVLERLPINGKEG